MRFAKLRGVSIVLCKILSTFVGEIFQVCEATKCICSQLAIFDAVQNPKLIRQTEKIFQCRKFFGNSKSPGTSAKRIMIEKKFLHFLIFPEKITFVIVLLGLLFLRKVPNGAK